MTFFDFVIALLQLSIWNRMIEVMIFLNIYHHMANGCMSKLPLTGSFLEMESLLAF